MLPDRLPHRTSRRTPAAFTLIELLVVISIIALLIAILLPALEQARKNAQAVACKSNLRQMGVGEHLYANDFDGRLFSHVTSNGRGWWTSLAPYVQKVKPLTKCPAWEGYELTNWGTNYKGLDHMSYGYNTGYNSARLANPHLNRAGAVIADGWWNFHSLANKNNPYPPSLWNSSDGQYGRQPTYHGVYRVHFDGPNYLSPDGSAHNRPWKQLNDKVFQAFRD